MHAVGPLGMKAPSICVGGADHPMADTAPPRAALRTTLRALEVEAKQSRDKDEGELPLPTSKVKTKAGAEGESTNISAASALMAQVLQEQFSTEVALFNAKIKARKQRIKELMLLVRLCPTNGEAAHVLQSILASPLPVPPTVPSAAYNPHTWQVTR